MKKLRHTYLRLGRQLLVLWWFVRRPETQGVKCLIECQGRILLVRPSYGHRRFMVPGGGVRMGEDTYTAAVRELFEETGIRVSSLTYFGTYTQVVEYKHDTVTCYYGSVTNDVVRIDDFEIVEAAWFAPTLLPADCSPSVHKILSLYESFKQ